MNKLSVVIITKNEEKNIARVLDSIAFADEIAIVDSGSTDGTLAICEKYDCKIINIDWLGFGKTKHMAVDSAQNDWVLQLDADEQISADLGIKIQEILKNPQYNAYKIKRMSYYLGKLIKHCGWNKDYNLRLFNRQYGNFNDALVHESVEVDCKVGKIDDWMLHYTYPNLETYIKKMEHYAHLETYKRKKKSSIFLAFVHGIFKFFKMFFLDFGFLDGKIGFVLSINSAFSVYYKYMKVWESQR